VPSISACCCDVCWAVGTRRGLQERLSAVLAACCVLCRHVDDLSVARDLDGAGATAPFTPRHRHELPSRRGGNQPLHHGQLEPECVERPSRSRERRASRVTTTRCFHMSTRAMDAATVPGRRQDCGNQPVFVKSPCSRHRDPALSRNIGQRATALPAITAAPATWNP
jgi:hypothetical protein